MVPRAPPQNKERRGGRFIYDSLCLTLGASSGMKLRGPAQKADGIAYGSVQMAVRRIGERQERDKSLRETVGRLRAQLFYVET